MSLSHIEAPPNSSGILPTISDSRKTGESPLISARTFWAVSCALVLAGMWLRTLGYFTPLEFWLDESLWARRFAGGDPGFLRPPGYVWLSRELIEYHATEPVIRLPSYIAGLLSLPLVLAMLVYSGLRRPVILFGLFLLATHAVAITFTKEFKPYELELFLHFCLLALGFAHSRTSSWWPLVGLCALAVAAPFFAWSVVVLYPGLFIAATVLSLRRRERAKLALVALGVLVTTGALLWLYVNVHAKRSTDIVYWGDKYDVFFIGESWSAGLRWYVEKTYSVLSFPGYMKILWFDSAFPNPVLAGVWVAFCLLGLGAAAIGRRWLWALLWISPLFVTMGLNAIGKWPYGVFRSNLFLLAYSLPIGLIGLNTASQWLSHRVDVIAWRLRGAHVVPTVCLALGVLCLPIRPSYFSVKATETFAVTQSTRRAMEIIAAAERQNRSPFRDRPGRDLLLLDSHAYGNYNFYRIVHAESRRRLGPFLNRKFRPRKGGYSAAALLEIIALESRWGFWLVVSKPSLVGPAMEQAHRFCHVDHLIKLPVDNLILRCLRKN